MRTTPALDDGLPAGAQRLTGNAEVSALVRQALQAFVARESARRLARLGGSEPDLAAAPRRRPSASWSSSTPRCGSTTSPGVTRG